MTDAKSSLTYAAHTQAMERRQKIVEDIKKHEEFEKLAYF